MLGFIESPKRRKDSGNPQPPRPQIGVLVFMGLLLINTVTFSFIPMSQSLSMNVTILFLVLVFIPLLFLAIYLANKFGYGIILAGFLSLPGAAIAVLVLGDFFGVIMGRIIIENIDVRKSTFYSHAKIFQFNDPVLLKDKGIDVTDSHSVLQRPGGGSQLTTMHYKIVPVVDRNFLKTDKIGTWAICTLLPPATNCEWDKNAKGGFQVGEAFRSSLLLKVNSQADELDLKTWQSPIFIFWVSNPKERILIAGYYGLGFLFFLNLFWIASVLLYYRIKPRKA
ncbi:MAG: hypothetical protein GW938_03260 [Leptospira sp.]|nr:hypothetical protein [Leptospira sp.]NCS95327.1 hypothetical protein [Leptospira sp.]